MVTPTPEQLAVLDNTNRIRVVRASPGSGKTWLVAEIIRKEMNNWISTSEGIAALSFTRVGGAEIHKARGFGLDHPHFVGTIDAFLFRYVIRPFMSLCFPQITKPHLLPEEWGIEHWGNYGANKINIVGKGINLFGCLFVDEENGNPVIARKPHPAQPLQKITDSSLYNDIKTGKNNLWINAGCLTHSDAAFLASRILEHHTYGDLVRGEIKKRFPFLIVDELQDTGFFLGKCIRLILSQAGIRSVLVGDPDQAIYEFNGARPVSVGLFL